MRFLADENCDRLVVAALREAGHDVVFLAEEGGSTSDDDVFRRARREHRTILTNDRDFGLLTERSADRPPAVVLMRLNPLSRAARAGRMAEAVTQLSDGVSDELVVIEPAQIRRRPYQRI